MLDCGDETVVVGHASGRREHSAASAALILVALSRIGDREGVALCLIPCCRTRSSSRTCLLGRRSGENDAGATRAVRPPYAGNVNRRIERNSQRKMSRLITYVIDL